jgi:hypothetical protein
MTRSGIIRLMTLHFESCAMTTSALLLAGLPTLAQSQEWIQQLGTSASEWTSAAAPDSAGGVFITGPTTKNLGGVSAGGPDAWLARYDGTGNRLWILQFGSSSSDYPYGAASDSAGGVYLSGYTYGKLGGTSAGGSPDAWIARYDGAGNQLWIRQLGTSSADWGRTAAPDSAGGVYVGGATEGSLGAPNSGSSDVWLGRFDNAGNPLWIHQFGTSRSEGASAVALVSSGGVYSAGTTFGKLGGSNAGREDAWLARHDSTGNLLWIRQFGTSQTDEIWAAAEDSTGGVYVSGRTFGGLGGPSAGLSDAWLARFDGAGNQLWIRQFGTPGFDRARAAAPDSTGGVYVAGATDGTLGSSNMGDYDAWLSRFDGSGNQLGILQIGTVSWDDARAVAPAPGGVYVSGETHGALGGNHAGGNDAWIGRFDGTCAANSIYCTAKLNSAGCTPRIHATGSPSASAGSGFLVRASDVLDNKFGLFFYGTSGQQAVPFQGGTLCTKAPLVRTPLQSSGGTPPCGGTFSLDFNVYVASGADPQLVPGTAVDGQYWSRDPGFAPPDNTSLTDALHFVICP